MLGLSRRLSSSRLDTLSTSRFATEVDGPSHFLRDNAHGNHCPNGSTQLKQRLLQAAGWRLVSVPFYEWDRLMGTQEQHEYLQRLVSALGLTA